MIAVITFLSDEECSLWRQPHSPSHLQYVRLLSGCFMSCDIHEYEKQHSSWYYRSAWMRLFWEHP